MDKYLRIGIVMSLLLIIVSIFTYTSFASSNLSNEMIAWGFSRGKNNSQPNLDGKAVNILNKFGDYAVYCLEIVKIHKNQLFCKDLNN